jgi:predicted amidohydrolase YtcJ
VGAPVAQFLAAPAWATDHGGDDAVFTIYEARKIITMNPARPHATHVAVRDGRILGAGDLAELTGWGAHTVDRRFADKVLMPGLVEGHSHVMEGVFWRYVYCGYFDRMAPDGANWPGVTSIDDVLARLAEADAKLGDRRAPLAGWALDPIYFSTGRVSRADLDRVSTTRPIGVLHASAHIMNVNTKALELAGLLRPGVNHPGLPLGPDGLPTGELKGPDAMMPVGPHVGFDREILAGDERGFRDFARLCVRKGVTTAADLANLLPDKAVEMMLRVTGEPMFPARVVSLRRHQGLSVPELIARARELAGKSTDRLRLGIIKMLPTVRSRVFLRACAGPATTAARRTACGTCRRSSFARPTSWLCATACRSTPTPTATRRPS